MAVDKTNGYPALPALHLEKRIVVTARNRTESHTRWSTPPMGVTRTAARSHAQDNRLAARHHILSDGILELQAVDSHELARARRHADNLAPRRIFPIGKKTVVTGHPFSSLDGTAITGVIGKVRGSARSVAGEKSDTRRDRAIVFRRRDGHVMTGLRKQSAARQCHRGCDEEVAALRQLAETGGEHRAKSPILDRHPELR